MQYSQCFESICNRGSVVGLLHQSYVVPQMQHLWMTYQNIEMARFRSGILFAPRSARHRPGCRGSPVLEPDGKRNSDCVCSYCYESIDQSIKKVDMNKRGIHSKVVDLYLLSVFGKHCGARQSPCMQHITRKGHQTHGCIMACAVNLCT